MRLATVDDGTPDGRLVVVAPDGRACAAAPVRTLQLALESWSEWEPRLASVTVFTEPLAGLTLRAPLPRAWQWLDGSAFPNHGELMARVFGKKHESDAPPLMYQGLSDHFYGPCDDVPFPDEAMGIDFEGEFGIITDAVPMGITPEAAASRIRLVVQINDWSLRNLAAAEMKTGFGWVQAKPACSMAPFAVTPDELGSAWQRCRVGLDLQVDWNGARFGSPNGRAMGFGFHELVAHAARTRWLPAGTVIGSGTVSNADYAVVGSTCIAERRGIEMLEQGEPRTQYLRFGDSLCMRAVDNHGAAPFGEMRQKVVRG
jgi:fumarylacetoacetate (FAA) hydrolase